MRGDRFRLAPGGNAAAANPGASSRVQAAFLSVYTSKDEQRRATILEIRRKGNVEKLRVVGSSALTLRIDAR